MGDWLQVGPAGNRVNLAVPDGGIGAGVLVLPAWWGLTSVFTDVCDRQAAELVWDRSLAFLTAHLA